MTTSKPGPQTPAFPVDPSENVVVRWNGQYWAPRRRGSWRVVTPLPEADLHSRETRAINLTVGGATGIFTDWAFSTLFAAWAWSPLVGLLVGAAGAASLVVGLVLLGRQRRFTSFVELAPTDLFGLATHLDGLPKLVDLDASPAHGSS